MRSLASGEDAERTGAAESADGYVNVDLVYWEAVVRYQTGEGITGLPK